jgi:type IV pilus assembly protein PilV
MPKPRLGVGGLNVLNDDRRRISLLRAERRGEGGFTLIEVIIAISILSIGILGVATMQSSAIRANFFAGNTSSGTSWASDKMEELVALAYEDYEDANLEDKDGDGDGGLDHATAGTADYNENQGQHTIYWNISEESLLNDTKTIRVIVRWADHGAAKNVTMTYAVPKI